MVVAPVVFTGQFSLAVHGSAKFPAPDHQGLIEQAALLEVVDQGGMTFGETDSHSYNIVRDPVHVHDLHATILHPIGKTALP